MIYDLIIIGMGISGITSAIYAKRSNLSILCLEQNDSIGGALKNIKKINNYPGYDEISGEELINNLKKQLDYNNISVNHETVTNIVKEAEYINVTTNQSNIYKGKNILISTGRYINSDKINNIDKYIGHGVSYCAVCDGFFFKNKDVMVVDKSNKSIDDVNYLSNIVNKVYLLSNNEYQNLPSNVDIIKNRSIIGITGENIVESVILDNNEEIKLHGVFFPENFNTKTNFINSINIDNEDGYIKVDNNMKTNIENIYASGDAIKKNIYQLVTASNDAIIATIDIIKNK